MRLRILAVAIPAAAMLVVPAAASAATKAVYMGVPPKPAKTFQNKYGSDVNDYFPHTQTIHVGDSVKFLPVGFHTVNFPGRGNKPLPLVSAGALISGVNDAAGNPFWFNGKLPQLGFNPALFASLYGKSATFNGKNAIETGLPVQQKPKPVKIKFTKTGSFTYYCNVHAGMKGVIKVKAKHARIPGSKATRRLLAKQVARDLKIAKKLAKKAIPTQPKRGANTNAVNVGYAGGHGVEFYGMVPGKLTVRAGTSVTFHMSRGSFEDHTATFGPGNPEQPNTYLGQIAASFQGAPTIDPRGANPSDAPNTTPSLSPTLHGNGFWNTGVMDRSAATPLPVDGIVTFSTPGTYDYYCMIHPFMHGQVIVK